MKRLLAWLFGAVEVTVTGAEPEGLLNLCAREGVLLWKTIWRDPFSLDLRLPLRQYALLCTLAGRAQCRTEERRRWGIPVFLKRFRRRYALWAGLALCLAVALYGSQVILTIEVSGNETLTAEEIISQLRLCGVEVGTFGPSIPIREKENRLMLAMDRLAFCALNRRGTCLEVIVRERKEPPAVLDESRPSNVLSAATGIITHMEPWAGDAQFQEGDIVVKGEVLISGIMEMDPPPNVWLEDGAENMGTALVHAHGKVLARTWHTLTARLDLNAPVKVYTGEETTRYGVSVMGKRLKIYKNSSIPYEKYDTIIRFKSWTPVEGKTLPLVWERAVYREYTLSTAPLDPKEGEAMLRGALLERVESVMDQGKILRTDWQCGVEGDILTVTLLAQCSEQIGRLEEVDTTVRAHWSARPPERLEDIEKTDTTEDSP